MSIKPLTSFLSLSLSLSTTREVPKRMETMGAFLDGEWESIFKMFSTDEPDFPCYNAAVNVDDSTMNYPLNVLNSINCSQNESFDLVLANDISLSMDIGAIGVENGGLLPQIFLQHMNENVCTDDPDDCQSGILASPCAELLFKRKCNESECRAAIEENVNSVATQKKKARFCRATQKGKGKKEMEKEDVPCNANNEDATNATPCGQSISCDTSDIESNASQETNGQENSESKEPVTLTLQGKKRASRGAATDPQSLYARRRRMKINERLRILQNLVPNGTKVDISTMLEEAFHYVKFLQLQIKLLSSDELWMFAPIAYNGHDVGLYQRASPFQLL